MDSPLLSSKLHIPPLRATYVSRPRVLTQLDQGLASKLTLVSSLAGSGKTTLLCDWIRNCNPPVGWLSLSKEDNDLARFLAYLIAALQNIDDDIDNSALLLFNAPQVPPLSAVLTSLIGQIEEINEDFILVLDDYHLITEENIHKAIDFLLQHLPPKMHLVIASRADPPLQLARLRSQGELVEVRIRDLRFSEKETADFLAAATEHKIQGKDLETLHTRTEGWVAGLQMAAMAMGGKEDVGEFIQSFSGSHRYILDYLIEEILDQQTDDVRLFLYQTSILNQFNSALCNAVCTREDSHQILDYLFHSNLFIEPLDETRQWYRYHHLFADLLRIRLQENLKQELPDLHLKASHWYEQNGMISLASDHALYAQHFERAIALIEGIAEKTLMRSEVATLMRWKEKLPKSLIITRPNLHILILWAQMLLGYDYAEVLKQIKRMDDKSILISGRKSSLLAFIEISRTNMEKAAEYAQQALLHVDEEDIYFRSSALWVLGMSQTARHDLENACQVLEELLQQSKRYGNTMFIVLTASQLARIKMRMGALAESEKIYHSALDAGKDRRGKYLPIAGEALMGLGELYRELDRLDEATDTILEGIELIAQWRDVAALDGYVSLARVKQAQGHWDTAQDALDKAMELAIRYEATDLDDRMVSMWQAQLWIAQNQLDRAGTWADGVGLVEGDDLIRLKDLDLAEYQSTLRESLVLTRLWIAQKDYAKAIEWIAWQLPAFREQNRAENVIDLLLQQALAYQAQGHSKPALESLKDAVDMAEPDGFLRIFLDWGQPIKHLLGKLSIVDRSRKYVGHLINRFDVPANRSPTDRQALIDPLSKREIEVLRFLPTNLTTPEIAEDMVIGVHTVRSHIKSIYSKLAVHNRSAAVIRAQELELL